MCFSITMYIHYYIYYVYVFIYVCVYVCMYEWWNCIEYIYDDAQMYVYTVYIYTYMDYVCDVLKESSYTAPAFPAS